MPVYSIGTSKSPRPMWLSAVVLILGTIASGLQSFPVRAGEAVQPLESTSSEQTTARKITPTSFTALPPAAAVLPTLPLAFAKTTPESIDDLREMESHVRSLVARMTETTVALTIGNAQGSGVIVSEDGMVLTAAHVSGSPGRQVTITLSDGTRAFGRSLGRNKTLDASLIRIDSPQKTWPYAHMARVEEVHAGDWSIVMGHPGGHQPDRLPVFRLGRVIEADSQVIQTDNELVGGDSGGPLFDMYGRVIGINSRIGPDTALNLHTPIDAYADDWVRLAAGEEIFLHSGAVLGISAEPVSGGLKVTKVWPGDPAERAGLREGDILTQFDSRRVGSFDRLRELVGENEPGNRIVLTIRRNAEVMEVPVRLGSMEERGGR
jgi:serine protease Do